ncbi:MAG: S-layer homology domain-containing protein [bacterium]
MKKAVFSLLLVLAFGFGLSFVSADTLDDAITWMQGKGITNSTGRDTYKADTNVSRQASAKFIVQFAKAMKKKMTAYIYSNAQCAFTDVAKNNSLKPDIQLACKLGYITGKSKKFSPSGTFTLAQAVVTVMRIMEGRKSEKVTPWYKNYFDAATKK